MEIIVIIAFLTESGLIWLPKKKYPLSKFIVGVDLGITSPDAIKSLQLGHADVHIFVDSSSQNLFHPKAIYIKTVDSEYLIVGSTNLTCRGLSTNYEMGLLTERDDGNTKVFEDFHDYYRELVSSRYCFRPDEQFYREYAQDDAQLELSARLRRGKLMPRIDIGRLVTLGDFLRKISEEFPKVVRRRGNKIKDHDLKIMNDTEFSQLFSEIAALASGGQLEGASTLNVGGNWRIIPIIEARDRKRKLWGNSHRAGVMAVQIHFNDTYSKVRFSLVVQYEVDMSVRDGHMPELVSERLNRISIQLEMPRAEVLEGLTQFKKFDYAYEDEKVSVWSKPILTFEYAIDSLPSDEQLYRDLCVLSEACVQAIGIK